jgi:hypothetical protein
VKTAGGVFAVRIVNPRTQRVENECGAAAPVLRRIEETLDFYFELVAFRVRLWWGLAEGMLIQLSS